MKHPRILTALAVGLTSIWFMPMIHADEWDKKTTITINAPIQLPTLVLQPGTYVMKLLNSQSDRHIVQVFDRDQKHLITTILAIPNQRLLPTSKSEFDFWEVPAGQPRALRAWFYPGDNVGQEFAYPKNLSTQIAAYTNANVPTTEDDATSDFGTPRASQVESSADRNVESRELETRALVGAQAPPPPVRTLAPVAAEPVPSAQPVQLAQATLPQVTQPSATSSELPQTASPLPVIGLIGLVSLATLGLTLRGRLFRF